MNAQNGFNPMRWKCDRDGCYNVSQRPKIEVFADCLPGRIAFTDIDATVEVNGRFLFIEFKGGPPRDPPTGQRIYLERLTRLSQSITAIVVHGESETMETTHLRTIKNGRWGEWESSSLDQLKSRVRAWAARAQAMSPVKAA